MPEGAFSANSFFSYEGYHLRNIDAEGKEMVIPDKTDICCILNGRYYQKFNRKNMKYVEKFDY